MEFVYMTREGVGVAKIPAAAVPHWEGYGWVRTDPPPKPSRPTFQAPASTKAPAPVAEPKTADTPKKPSTRRKED